MRVFAESGAMAGCCGRCDRAGLAGFGSRNTFGEIGAAQNFLKKSACILQGVPLLYLFAHTVRPDIAGWSSLVARRAHNPEVVGSNPAPATKNFVAWKSYGFQAFCYSGSMFSTQFSTSQVKISICICNR